MHYIAVEEKEDDTITTKMAWPISTFPLIAGHIIITLLWCEILLYRRKFNVYLLSEISAHYNSAQNAPEYINSINSMVEEKKIPSGSHSITAKDFMNATEYARDTRPNGISTGVLLHQNTNGAN